MNNNNKFDATIMYKNWRNFVYKNVMYLTKQQLT